MTWSGRVRDRCVPVSRGVRGPSRVARLISIEVAGSGDLPRLLLFASFAEPAVTIE